MMALSRKQEGLKNMATQNQVDLCKSILLNDYGAWGGSAQPADYVFNRHDFVVWSDCLDCSEIKLPTGKALSGLVSSAVQAGLVYSSGETVCLTEAGYNLAKGI